MESEYIVTIIQTKKFTSSFIFTITLKRPLTATCLGLRWTIIRGSTVSYVKGLQYICVLYVQLLEILRCYIKFRQNCTH